MKRENDMFLVITLKLVSGLTVVVNRPGSPKLWAIANEKGIKRENDEFFIITLKHVSGLTVVENRPTTPKLWQ